MSEPNNTMDILEIMSILPHRYPLLLIDRIVEMERKTRIVAIKNVTINEPHFAGHFPDFPIMPGVLIVEAMAQVACAMFLSKPEAKNKLAYFMGMEEIKFRKPVVPGDRMELKVEVLKMRDKYGKAKGEAFVDGKLATEATFSFAIVDKPES